MLAQNAAVFAIKNATAEGKITVIVLVLLSLFSWTIILGKFRQLLIARKATKKFLAAYQLYIRGADELVYQLKNNPVVVTARVKPVADHLPPGVENEHTDFLAKSNVTKISTASFDAVRVTLEEAAGAEAMGLEKGMIVLSTAVAGGPFIGLLGTVWGVMSTFASIAVANSASLTTMAPGVAAALVATVTGLLVAIPAMFAYNFMVTTIRAITQELDGFATRYATQIEHVYVDNRPLAEEIKSANETLAGRIVEGLRADESSFRKAPALT
jgi:biopolymer transport protein TolQ